MILVLLACLTDLFARLVPTGAAPTIQIEAPCLPDGYVTMTTAVDEGIPKVSASTVRPDNYPFAVVFLVSTNEMWLPRHEEEEFEHTRDPIVPGLFHSVQRGLTDVANLELSPDSRAEVIGYDVGARVLHPFASLSTLPDALGNEKDYRRLGVDLAEGVSLALDELEKRTEPHKLLVIVGDGSDTRSDEAVFRNLRRRAQNDQIAVTAYVYKNAASVDGMFVSKLVPTAKWANSFEGLRAGIVEPFLTIRARRVIEFPTESLPHDGKPRDYVIHVDTQTSEPFEITLLGAPPQPPTNHTWWPFLIVPLGAALLLLTRRLAR